MSAAIADLRKVVYDRAGIVISSERDYMFDGRLQPVLRRFGVHHARDLVARIREGDAAVADAVVDAMSTNETYFFRDRKPFEAFRTTVLPELVRTRAEHKRIRIWSAACATGQEPYSLAILLDEARAGLLGWSTRILATDICGEALEKAESGCFSQFEVQRGLSVARMLAYFEKSGDQWKINGAPPSMVTFRRHNLVHDNPVPGPFDIVFCRNVLIYFDQPTRDRVLEKIARAMAPDGYLMLGASETMLFANERYDPVPGVRGLYRLRAEGRRATA